MSRTPGHGVRIVWASGFIIFFILSIMVGIREGNAFIVKAGVSGAVILAANEIRRLRSSSRRRH